MSVMLATTNPDAVGRIAPRPMPEAGDVVLYHMRPGAMRAGQTSVPGFVLAVDQSNRQLKLLVIFGQDDMLTEERVPERIGTDYGWVIKSSADAQVPALRAEVESLKGEIAAMSDGLEAFKLELAQTLFGEHDKPAESFEDRLRAIGRILKDLATPKTPKGKDKAK